MGRKFLIAGNWKMNGLAASESELRAIISANPSPACDILLCPPATLTMLFSSHTQGTPIAIGGQDCHAAENGAHTGDIAAPMLRDAGASYVILGHSERRTDHGETDATVNAKTKAAWIAGLCAVICVGESEAERDAGSTLDMISRQLAASVPDGGTAENLVIAYEPVWAIGTGRTPTLEQIGEVHDHIRTALRQRFRGAAEAIRILYGGSMKPENCGKILKIENVDGGLIGGASLKAADFNAIISAASNGA